MFKKRKEMEIKLNSMYWLTGTENKLLLYKLMLKPIWI